MADFFISRAGEDAEFAVWIAGVLEEAGFTTIVQDLDFQPGDSFVEQMRLGLERADRMIAVLSPHYPVKAFTTRELYSAIAGQKRIIPVRVADCEAPHPIKDLIWINFVGKSEEERRRALLNGVCPARKRREIRTSIQKLPVADPHLFGRDQQIDWLEQAWANPLTNFVQIIAPGGTGKTALMTKWYRRHLEDVTIFGWSFYSQGTREKSETSSEPFFAAALPWFGVDVKPTDFIWTKVDRLVAHLRHERVLLILDGIEPLQNTDGSLRDPSLKALLNELAARNAGVVLCTTRLRLTDVPDDAPLALSLDLENLDPADGARYLAHLKVQGPEDELRAASEAYGNHAFALTLLGTYLVTFCDGDVRRRTDIRDLQVEETKPGRHARKMMAGYARMYEGQPELDILRALGYFDRPAEPEALKLVLPEMEDRRYRAALRSLHDARLILTMNPAHPIDCHPLVREYFAAQATKEGHARLYEHYKEQAPQRPDTLEEMAPLFHAVYHGCQAGQHVECLNQMYLDRILRGNEFYLIKKIGALGTDLLLLANFFTKPWTGPVPSFSPADQSWVISEAAVSLRAVGRLADAVDPMRAGAEAYVRAEDWRNAARGYSNLSQIHVALGNLKEATATAAARKSVDFADRSSEAFERMVSRTTLADALHQSGDAAGARRLFAEAERLQAERQPQNPILYSVQGYQYCDLLLAQGQTAEVLRRASQALIHAERRHLLLDIGLDHLSLGRGYPRGSAEATHHLDQAVDFLRRAGTLHLLPRALLARGTPRDLDEVLRIATRSGMRLHLTDYHLAAARLALANNDRDKARDHLDKAADLVNQTGYHRRDPEIAELRSLVT